MWLGAISSTQTLVNHTQAPQKGHDVNERSPGSSGAAALGSKSGAGKFRTCYEKLASTTQVCAPAEVWAAGTEEPTSATRVQAGQKAGQDEGQQPPSTPSLPSDTAPLTLVPAPLPSHRRETHWSHLLSQPRALTSCSEANKAAPYPCWTFHLPAFLRLVSLPGVSFRACPLVVANFDFL